MNGNGNGLDEAAERYAVILVQELRDAQKTLRASTRAADKALQVSLRRFEAVLKSALRQFKRTSTPNNPPKPNSMKEGELCFEMAEPRRMWLGVPEDIDRTGRVLMIDVTELARLSERVRELEKRLNL